MGEGGTHLWAYGLMGVGGGLLSTLPLPPAAAPIYLWADPFSWRERVTQFPPKFDFGYLTPIPTTLN